MLVKRCTWQLTGPRARGQDDLLGQKRLRRCAGDRDFIAARNSRRKGSTAMEEADFVFLEQKQNAIVVLLDHRVLATDHLADIKTQAGHANAVLAKMVGRLFEMFGRLQQRL